MSRETIAIIGEGITEKYYIESLKGLSPFTLLPQELGKKASSLKDLENSIKKAIKEGYDAVYCLIDMDTKRSGTNKDAYYSLKNKYHKEHKTKNNQTCNVVFIETERCTELWFLYHFTKSATTREFRNYEELEQELKKFRSDYGKNDSYFRKNGGIHKNLTELQPKGSLEQAVRNAENSVESRDRDGRTHTYSEMGRLIKALKIIKD